MKQNNPKVFLLCLIILLTLFNFHMPIKANFFYETVNIVLSDDTLVSENIPDYNWDNDGFLIIQSATTAGYAFRVLMAADLSMFTPTTTIHEAKLYIYYYNYPSETYNPKNRPVDLLRNTENWAEETATWNNKPSYTTYGKVDGTHPTNYGWWSFTVTSIVQSFVDEEYPNYGWTLKFDTETTGYAQAKYYDHENGNPNLRPYLWVNYTISNIFVNFHYTDYGKFLYNGTLANNETVIHVENASTLRLIGAPDANKIWLEFKANDSSITINNYNYTVYNNVTLWCYFDSFIPEGIYIETDDPIFMMEIVFLICIVCLGLSLGSFVIPIMGIFGIACMILTILMMPITEPLWFVGFEIFTVIAVISISLIGISKKMRD